MKIIIISEISTGNSIIVTFDILTNDDRWLETYRRKIDYCSEAGIEDAEYIALRDEVIAAQQSVYEAMTAEAIEAIFVERQKEAIRSSFFYKKYRVTIDSYNYVTQNLPALVTYLTPTLSLNNPQWGELNENVDRSLTIYLNEILPAHRDIISQHSAVIHVEDNPYYNV